MPRKIHTTLVTHKATAEVEVGRNLIQSCVYSLASNERLLQAIEQPFNAVLDIVCIEVQQADHDANEGSKNPERNNTDGACSRNCPWPPFLP